MTLRISKGNMFNWVTHTLNTVSGECPHNCKYCYVKRFGKQKPMHFNEKALKTDLGKGNTIFVGSGFDLFAWDVPSNWILDTLDFCNKFDNTYLFQTKNPERMLTYLTFIPEKVIVGTTIESNREYKDISLAPPPSERAKWLSQFNKTKEVTIEPILDFDFKELVEMIKSIEPVFVNIGADTGNNCLPEPPSEKIRALIMELEKFTKVKIKENLQRLMK